MIADYHVHTYFSSDCKVNPREYIQKAIDEGMKEICFTDHMDYDYPDENGLAMFKLDTESYFKELRQLRAEYFDSIKIKIGIELGLNPVNEEKNRALADAYPFDFVIGSSHIVDGKDPYYPEFWSFRNTKEAIMDYYKAVLRNVTTYDDYDVYGHLDYVRRYVKDKDYVYVDEDFYDITDMILKNIIAKGHGIELNTKGLSNGLTYFVPTISLLKRYKELGGEIVTVGSDAHYTKSLGYAFKTARYILINTGFKYVATFEDRTPTFAPLT